MVRSIINTCVAIILSISFFIFTEIYLQKQFDEFYGALDGLYDKVELKQANREDAYAVRSMWQEKKRNLHIFIPHNDISYIDYWLNEACTLIYTQNYELALGKIEVLREIAKNLPDGYSVAFENVF